MKIKVIKNFLDDKDLTEISNIELKKIGSKEVKVYHNSISGEKIIKNDCIGDDFLKRLNRNYHDKAVNILKELYPEKEKLYDFSEFHLIETGANYEFVIHDDTPDKLLSGVIYLKPEKNVGTIFYKNKKGDGRNEIEWKINKGVFFSRTERQSWHSYKGDNKSNRIALVYNLMTKRIKEVYRIENKNYFIGNLRFRLNPYLNRFFKFTL
tara:strand:+ start:91 stop:717 length:627 start_codon:yes stop_codon:yes gene_type:complete